MVRVRQRFIAMVGTVVIAIASLPISASVAAQEQFTPSPLRALQWWASAVPYKPIDCIIAIVNSGISPELDPTGNWAKSIIGGWDAVNNIPDYADLDPNHHGTRVAGIIAGGYQGIAPKAKILAVRASRIHVGGSESPDMLGVASGIRWSVDNHARVVICPSDSLPLDEIANAVEYARQHGVIVVGSSGNDGEDKDITPGCWNVPSSNIIQVAGTLETGMLAANSAYGHRSVDVTAPSDSFLMIGSTPDEFRWSFPGTSGSAAITRALAAMLFDLGLTEDQVIKRIFGSVDLISDLQNKVWTGGVINFERALLGSTNAPRDSLSFKIKVKKKKLTVSGTETPINSQAASPILRIWIGQSLAGSVTPQQDGAFRIVIKGRFMSGTEVRVQSSLGGEMIRNIP